MCNTRARAVSVVSRSVDRLSHLFFGISRFSDPGMQIQSIQDSSIILHASPNLTEGCLLGGLFQGFIFNVNITLRYVHQRKICREDTFQLRIKEFADWICIISKRQRSLIQ
ncbi:probable G-protein coupled receptor 160 isoform X2 [Ambystoma mexicanum]|uniref:probable G-protein coupled receptor 160 isoform X2 n=1 Tax=Ambystoma mexicanum TaxID=8296 RepID=UPI0037E8B30A